MRTSEISEWSVVGFLQDVSAEDILDQLPPHIPLGWWQGKTSMDYDLLTGSLQVIAETTTRIRLHIGEVSMHSPGHTVRRLVGRQALDVGLLHSKVLTAGYAAGATPKRVKYTPHVVRGDRAGFHGPQTLGAMELIRSVGDNHIVVAKYAFPSHE